MRVVESTDLTGYGIWGRLPVAPHDTPAKRNLGIPDRVRWVLVGVWGIRLGKP